MPDSFDDFVAARPDAAPADVTAAWNAQPPAPRPGPAYLTYLSMEERTDLFGPLAGNLAGAMRNGLLGWIAGPDLSLLDPSRVPQLPNPGRLSILHARLDGSPGVDLTAAATPGLLALFAAGVDAAHPPLLTAGQAAALLGLGYDVPPAKTADDVTAARAVTARHAAVAVERAKVQAYLNDVLNPADADANAPLVTTEVYFAPAGGGQ